MSTIADLVRTKPDPYAAAIAVFRDRFPDREAGTVRFEFADKSELTFKVTYSLMESES